MYLDGQLPYGPKSSNPGAPPIPTFDNPGVENTYLIPGGGPSVVSPSVATADGIVQTPSSERQTQQFNPLNRTTARYGRNGDYAADGSLETIAKRAGRGMGVETQGPVQSSCASSMPGLGDCQSGPQSFVANTVAQPEDKGIALAVGIMAVIILLNGGSK